MIVAPDTDITVHNIIVVYETYKPVFVTVGCVNPWLVSRASSGKRTQKINKPIKENIILSELGLWCLLLSIATSLLRSMSESIRPKHDPNRNILRVPGS